MALLLPVHQPTSALASAVGCVLSKDSRSLVSAVPGWLVIRPVLESGLGPAELIRVNGSIGSLSALSPPANGPNWLVSTFQSGLIELVVYTNNTFVKKHSFQTAIVPSKQPERHQTAVNASKTGLMVSLGSSLVHIKLQKDVKHFVQEFSDGIITSMAWVESKLAILYKQPGPVHMIGLYKVTPSRIVQISSSPLDDDGIKVLPWQDGALVVGTNSLSLIDAEGRTSLLRTFAEPVAAATLLGDYLLCAFIDGRLSRLDVSKSTAPLEVVATLDATSGIKLVPLQDTLLLVETLVSSAKVLRIPTGRILQTWTNPGPISNLLQAVDQGGHSQFITTGTEVLNSTAFLAKFVGSTNTGHSLATNDLAALAKLSSDTFITSTYSSTSAWKVKDGVIISRELPPELHFFTSSLPTLAASTNVQVTPEGLRLQDATIEIPLHLAAACGRKVVAAHEATLYHFNGGEKIEEKMEFPIVAVATNGVVDLYATETRLFARRDQVSTELPISGSVSSLNVTEQYIIAISTRGLVEIYDASSFSKLFQYNLGDRSPTVVVCESGIFVAGPASAALILIGRWGFSPLKLTGYPASHSAMSLRGNTVVNINSQGLQVVDLPTAEHLQTFSRYYPQAALGAMVQIREDRLVTAETRFETPNSFLPCDMSLRISNSPFQAQSQLPLGEGFVVDKILKVVWPQKHFQGFVVSAISMATGDEPTKALILLYDYTQTVLLDSISLKAAVADVCHVNVRENAPFFLVGITCHLQLWRLKSTDTGPKLQICRNVASVASAVSKIDYHGSYMFVADMIRMVSVAQIDRAGRANNILNCNTVRWAVSGAIIRTEPVQVLCGNVYGDLILLQVDSTEDNKQLNVSQQLHLGQTVTAVVRPNDLQIEALKTSTSHLLHSILPAAYLSTSAGGIYAYAPINDPQLKELLLRLVEHIDQTYPALGEQRSDSEIVDASFLTRFLNTGGRDLKNALDALGVDEAWAEELKFALDSILH